MRSTRSLLPLSLLFACSSPEVSVKPTDTPPPVPVVAPAVPAPPDAACTDEPLAEKTFYEAQRLLQRKRYWEAAPTFVISYNHCAHAQVLCAAGHAYQKAGNCDKSAAVLDRCLADASLPEAARLRGVKLKGDADRCLAGRAPAAPPTDSASAPRPAEKQTASAGKAPGGRKRGHAPPPPKSVASRGDEDLAEEEATGPDAEDAAWIGAKWQDVGGAPK